MSSELLAESLSMLLYTVAAAVLTVGGVLAEGASLQHLGSGELAVGLWLAAIGAVMLYAGIYGIAYKKLLASILARS
ncbi:hypothetical protein [Natronobacterium gregoryi]|uniref:DUF8151 domain-containing protein n=2 Tax=Natronobacterium gregoryi TaxID=44930 RepID=L0AII0_NATGS|nr:hypothetical protein [Natronobacterium gregoryi]AFZ72880.1 hypothetical protein Natgr_1681 [Natronobacterium gregoryi SP2]ELY69630.1 hypothetical protein C490_07496 [Natronobacterium gregoryi SP2]PLK21892.1 hypothetical protein CYV19_02000 [Natronobacterium gregoryi SP2]SFI66287.1 hypothetical protein SAMN05443661_10347 [Natronobacterium gregoryi]